MNLKTKATGLGLGTSFLFMILTGLTTVVIPNKWYIRMTPISLWDYIVYTLTGILLGIVVGMFYYKKNSSTICGNTATGGAILGFLTYGCSLCNSILVAILGTTGIITYFEPIRPWLGAAGIVLLMGAAKYQLKR